MTDETKAKNCKDCDHCIIKLMKPNRTGRELATSGLQMFTDSHVEKIYCALDLWSREFTSMAAFNASAIPDVAAENCAFYSPEEFGAINET